MQELQALQNAANSVKLPGLGVKEKFTDDKRRTVRYFFLTLNGTSISPVLDYDNMNHFILGFIRAEGIFNLKASQL
jgi:hypothetical protein